jgi:hypothetical protein
MYRRVGWLLTIIVFACIGCASDVVLPALGSGGGGGVVVGGGGSGGEGGSSECVAACPSCDDCNPCTVDTCTDAGCEHSYFRVGTKCGGVPLDSECTAEGKCTTASLCTTEGVQAECEEGQLCLAERCWTACEDDPAVCGSTPWPSCVPYNTADEDWVYVCQPEFALAAIGPLELRTAPGIEVGRWLQIIPRGDGPILVSLVSDPNDDIATHVYPSEIEVGRPDVAASLLTVAPGLNASVGKREVSVRGIGARGSDAVVIAVWVEECLKMPEYDTVCTSQWQSTELWAHCIVSPEAGCMRLSPDVDMWCCPVHDP